MVPPRARALAARRAIPRSPRCSGRANAEARRFSARQLAGWTSRVGARPTADPDDLAVLVKSLLTGLAIQRRLDPDSVDEHLALRGLRALLGTEEHASSATVAAPRADASHTATTRGPTTPIGTTTKTRTTTKRGTTP